MVQYLLAPTHQVAINEYRNRLAFSLCLDISVCVVTVTSQIQYELYHFTFVNVYISISPDRTVPTCPLTWWHSTSEETALRKLRESYWISTLGAMAPTGMNIDD